MKMSNTVGALAAALAKAQGAMANALKDSTNSHFKSRYADLASIVMAIKEPLSKHGIAYTQFPCTNDKDEVGVETILTHESGEWIAGDPFYVPVSKADAQGFGSALTYCRRYSLAAACGVAPDDDDGNAAASANPTALAKVYPMSSGEFSKHQNAIGTAPDELALKKAYSAAYVAAQALGDHDAVSRLTDCKDIRKAEIAQPQDVPQ